MEQLIINRVNQHLPAIIERPPAEDVAMSTDKPFIQANTVDMSLEEISQNHIIPVFARDNEPLIGHADLIEITSSAVGDYFHGEQILKPSIRVSHPIKGRVPEARNKPADQLQEWERTIYYERMAFVIELPSISDVVGGNRLTLTVGGVKAYNLDNLNSRKGTDEKFKLFIGFQNKVCTNLCVWTDGTLLDVGVKSPDQLRMYIRKMIEEYNHQHHLYHLKEFCSHSLTEQQFATLIGRCRMYHHLPPASKAEIPALLLGDTQINAVCKDYYRQGSFCRDADGSINLWRLYNLFTGANKGTYIDSFIDRASNAFDFTYSLKLALQEQRFNWYLS